MTGDRLKQLLRNRWARRVFAAGMVVKLALLAVALWGVAGPVSGA